MPPHRAPIPGGAAVALRIFGLHTLPPRAGAWPAFWPSVGGQRLARASGSLVLRPGFAQGFQACSGCVALARLLLGTPCTALGLRRVHLPVLEWLAEWMDAGWGSLHVEESAGVEGRDARQLWLWDDVLPLQLGADDSALHQGSDPSARGGIAGQTGVGGIGGGVAAEASAASHQRPTGSGGEYVTGSQLLQGVVVESGVDDGDDARVGDEQGVTFAEVWKATQCHPASLSAVCCDWKPSGFSSCCYVCVCVRFACRAGVVRSASSLHSCAP